MKVILSSLLFCGLFLLSGCTADNTAQIQSEQLPETFWGNSVWHFRRNEGVVYGASGTARVLMQFTRTSPLHYSVTGTIVYNEDDLSCSGTQFSGSICGDMICDVVGVKDGSIIGEAVSDNQTLTITLTYNSIAEHPREQLRVSCSDGTLDGSHETEMAAQTLQADGGMMLKPWTVDIADITFIDDVPESYESTNIKTAYKDFASAIISNVGEGDGHFALYRNKPN